MRVKWKHEIKPLGLCNRSMRYMKRALFSIVFVVVFGLYAISQPANSAPVAITATHKTASTISAKKTIAKAISIPAKIIPKPIAMGIYKDGTFTGAVADAYYGNVQVQVVTQNGKIVDVQFLDYPRSRGTSMSINSYATPILRSEAITAQSAQVDTVSGASATSGAFKQSLASALSQARV